MKIQTILNCIFLLLILSVSVSVILWYRSRINKLIQLVLNRINNAIDGNYSKEQYNEAMLSAIEEKLNKFLSISQENKNKTVKEKNMVKSLVSDISHQTRTPLSNILLYSQMLQERNDVNGEIAEIADQIQIQADKLSFLIHSLMQTSYLETDMISIQAQKEQIDKLIHLACQEVEIAALEKGIIIEYEECGLSCEFDLKWTLEAISNILDNAIKYSPKDSCIVIQVIPYEMFIRIDITDRGIGIAEEECGLIFQRFYRSPKVSQMKGLGIGLYLARKIITRQKGYIKVLSSPMHGSTFSVYLYSQK